LTSRGLRAIDVVTWICECANQAKTNANGKTDMAEHKHGEMDIKVQTETFDGFMKWTTWAVIVILAVLVFLAIFAR
jgi:hypothetical protein